MVPPNQARRSSRLRTGVSAAATLRPASPMMSMAKIRWRRLNSPTLLNQTVEVARWPGTRITGGASTGPHMFTHVVPKEDCTCSEVTSPGQLLNTVS